MSFAGPMANLVPPGVVLPFAGSTAPPGYLLCDGSAVSRATYAALYAAIGTAHGYGDQSTTFNIPDYRGRFMRGVDAGTNRDPDFSLRTAMATGGNTGSATLVGSVQGSAVGPHVHGIQGSISGTTAAPLVGSSTNGVMGSSAGTGNSYVTTLGSGNIPIMQLLAANGGGQDNRPVNAYVNYIIKY